MIRRTRSNNMRGAAADRRCSLSTMMLIAFISSSCIVTFPSSTLAFAPTYSPPFRIQQDARAFVAVNNKNPGGHHHHHLSRIQPLHVVADPPEKDKKKRRGKNEDDSLRNDDDDNESTSSPWIPTLGGFLPNLTRRRSRKQQQEEDVVQPKPLTKPKVIEVRTLQDYKSVVADEKERLVAVRFYAPWCKACKAIESRFRKLSMDYPDVKFVEVPLTEGNAFLHEGLGVPQLPYGHIYHPEAGLVDERSLNKKIFANFKKQLKTYIEGECLVDLDNIENKSEEDNDGVDADFE